MRDLVLLNFVHLGIARVVSDGLEGMVSEAYVWPSYSNIGSHPVECQLWRALKALEHTEI
jgi:hypothetical protein